MRDVRCRARWSEASAEGISGIAASEGILPGPINDRNCLCELSWINGNEMGVQFLEKAYPKLPGKADSDQGMHEI